MTKQTVEQLARALKPYVLAWITGATGAAAGASTQLHVLATNTSLGPLHSVSGVTPNSFLVANATGNDALMRIIAISDLPVHTSTHSHVDLVGVTSDQHHGQSHVFATTAGLGADHTTSGLSVGQVLRATSPTTAVFGALIAGDLPIHTHDHLVDLTNVTADQHHAQTHVLATTSGLGADHTVSGLTAGMVLRATGTTTAKFAALLAADLPIHTHDHDVDLTNVSADDHHAQSHVLATVSGLGADHTVSGLTAKQVLIATSPTAAEFAALDHDADLTGLTPDNHHAQSHILATTLALGADHTVSGLTAGQFIRATGAATAAFQAIATADLPDLPTPGTLSVASTNDGTAPHTHTITSSSNPGAAASILATDALGELQLVKLYTTDYVRADGGLTTANVDPGTNRLYVGDYGVILGGLHVGGTGDPGTDNLDVDGGVKIGIGGENPTAGQLALTGRIIESTPTQVGVGSSSAQTLATGTWEEIAFNTEITDPLGMHDNVTNNSRLTSQVDGTYLVTAQVRFLANATGDRGLALWRAQLSGNNRWIVLQITPTSSGSTDHYLNISTVIDLDTGQYIEARAFQTSGGNLDIGVLGNVVPHFSAIRIA